jgi:putative ABC transport system ATP-binding protein
MGDSVKVSDVHFAYRLEGRNRLCVFEGLSLAIRYREVIGIIGRNGSGKSTLLELIRGGRIPEVGEVFVGGVHVASGGRILKRPAVSIISQSPDAGLAPTMTVYENYMTAKGFHGLGLRWAYRHSAVEQCCDLLAMAGMGLEAKIDEQVRFLSNGQQQALSVLLALDSSAPIVLMDEPTASLDPVAAQRVLDLACAGIIRRGGSVILVSHRLRDVLERCDRILLLQGGKVSKEFDMHLSGAKEEDLLRLLVNEPATTEA